MPPAKRQRAEEVIGRLVQMLRWWIVGQVFAMIVVGVFTAAGLWILGTPAPLTLGILAFAFEIVPYVGPLVSAIPAILLAWPHGPMLALYVALLYLGIHGVEAYILMPLVESRAVEIPPALDILAVLLLGMLAGVLGILLAAPLLLTCMVLVRMLYIHDVLDDHSVS